MAIEHKFFQWLHNERQKKDSRIMVDPERMIDFPTMKQVNIFNVRRQRPVKRGK